MADDILDQLPLFQGFSSEQLLLVRPLFVACDGYADMLLFEQGAPAEFLYLVVSGEVAICYKPDDGPALTVARIRPGGVAGWSAALGSRLYTSGALCTAYTHMLRVRGSELRSLCEAHPDTGILILERLATVVAERLRNTHEQVMLLLKQGLRASVHNV